MHDKIGEIDPFPGRNPAHHAVIKKTDDITGQNENIAGMGVRMKKTMHKDLLHEKDGAPAGDQPQVMAAGLQQIDFRGLDALNIFHGDNFSGAEPAINLGDVNCLILQKLPGKALDISCLQIVIDLLFNTAGKNRDDPGGPLGRELFQVPLHEIGEMEHDLQIRFNDLPDAGPLHLDHHLFAIDQPGPVHLTDGGGGQRLFFKLLEDDFGRLA